jgi:signal transduction histidine kinase
MGSAPRPHLRAHRLAPLESFSRTERIIAFCRVLLATATLAVIIADPRQPSFKAPLAYLLLNAYIVYSGVVFLLVRQDYLTKVPNAAVLATAADIVWVTILTRFTEAGLGPFFLLHVFVISSVSVRWGLRATMAVTVILSVLYPSMLLAVHIGTGGNGGDDPVFRPAYLLRPLYLIILGYLIGYLGEHERRSRRKLGFMLEVPESFRLRPAARGLARLMRDTLVHFDSQHGIIVLRDPETDRYFRWDVRRGRRTRLGLKISETNPLPLKFADPTWGFLANDLRPATSMALCYDMRSDRVMRTKLPSSLALPGSAQNMLVAPIIIGGHLRGHALAIREVRRKFTRDDLEFLLLIVGQAAAGFENVRLQEKAEEVAVLEERARIARDLHDGFIQSLAGIDLRIEACKMLLQRDPRRVRRELEELHQAVDHGYREVRHYLNVLRAAGRPASELWTTLDRLAQEFSKREGIRVHLMRPSNDPGLSATTGFELAQIVREALRNAVRHGGATQAIVKVGTRASHLYLLVRDNGSGFVNGNERVDDDGFLDQGAAPWSIRERTAALGGRLRVLSHPGRGVEVSIVVPVDAASDRYGTDRRMYA